MMPRDKLNKLKTMNYQVDTEDGHYYMTEGLRSLFNFSKRYNVKFKALCIILYTMGQHTVVDPKTKIRHSITMI